MEALPEEVFECGDYVKSAPICLRTARGFHFFKFLAYAVPSPKPRTIAAVDDCELCDTARQRDWASSLYMGSLTGAAAIGAGLTEIFQLSTTIRACSWGGIRHRRCCRCPSLPSRLLVRVVRRSARCQRRSPARWRRDRSDRNGKGLLPRTTANRGQNGGHPASAETAARTPSFDRRQVRPSTSVNRSSMTYVRSGRRHASCCDKGARPPSGFG